MGPEGLQIASGSRSRLLPWNELSYAETEAANLFQSETLKIYDRRGKVAARLPASLQPFPQLRDAVNWHLRQPEVAAEPGEIARLQRQKSRKTGLSSVVVGVLFLALASSMLVIEVISSRDQQRLAREGVDGEAKIVELKLAPNGVTPRLIYRITTDSGSAERNVEVPHPYWDSLAGASTVPVRYLPDKPSVSRTPNEVDDEFGGVVIPILGIVMSLFFIGAGAFMLLGWDERVKRLAGTSQAAS